MSDFLEPNDSLFLFQFILMFPFEVDLLLGMVPMFHEHCLRDHHLFFLFVHLCLLFDVFGHSQPN